MLRNIYKSNILKFNNIKYIRTRGIEEFIDLGHYQINEKPKDEKRQFGRAWSLHELRNKSFEDLRALWILLYKEKNVILTEQNIARRKGSGTLGALQDNPTRKTKIKKSMARIKMVLAERQRERRNLLENLIHNNENNNNENNKIENENK